MRPLGIGPLLLAAVFAGAAWPALADRACNDKCDLLFSYCLQAGGSAIACQNAYFDCTGNCFFSGGDTPTNAPAIEKFDFAPIYAGTGVEWIPKYWNPFGDTASLYMSFTPPIASDLGNHSASPIPPWSFGYGDRWELVPGEGQKVQLGFAPSAPGVYKTTVYFWWDLRGAFYWHKIINFTGTAVDPPPQPVSPGGNGGTESLPSWMFTSPETHQPRLWMEPDAENGSARRRAAGSPGGGIPLRELIPATLAGMTPVFVTPQGVIGGSNATDSIAGNYSDLTTGMLRAVVLAMRTQRDVYSHVYGVCSRVKGGWLESISFPSVTVPGAAGQATFWQSSLITPESGALPGREIATGFAAGISPDGHQFDVDSHWLSEEYPTSNGDVVTFQMWSSDAATTAAARDAVLDGLRRRGTINYRNAQPRGTPDLFIASADYGHDSVQLITTNNGKTARTVNFDAVTWSAASSESEERFHFTRTIEPGHSPIDLPIAGRLNGVIYMNEQGSPWTDEIYFADGNWFSYSESSSPPWSTPACSELPLGPADLAVAGCGRIGGAIAQDAYRGLGRSVATYTREVLDVHDMRAIRFFAKGPEEIAEVRVTSKTEDGRFVTHGAYFTPSPEGRQLSIPFVSLQGRDDARGTPFRGDRVVQITWNVIGSPHAATDLTIGAVSFSPDMFVEGTPLPVTTSDTVGPYLGAGRIGATLVSPRGTLSWRRHGNAQFTRLPMETRADLLYASIPGQPAGSVIESYIELTDATGRTATSPPDAPYELNVFTVAEKPVVRIDDFDDRSLRNERGGSEATFHSGGASVVLDHEHATLHLTWDVQPQESFSGWISSFVQPVDGSTLDTLQFRIRGAAGAERLKVGLADKNRAEHKVVVAKFLDGGITTAWRDVQIPLAVFTTIDRKAISGLLFIFENGIGSGSGSVEVDDVAFASAGVTTVLVDNFDDGTNENAFGGAIAMATGGTATATPSRVNGAYQVAVHSDATSWAALVFDLRGFDARAMSRLRMRLRGTRGGESPHVYLVSSVPGQVTRQWVDVNSLLPLTTSWQQLQIPLNVFAAGGVDLQNLARIEVVWEWRAFDEAVEIDDVAFDASP